MTITPEQFAEMNQRTKKARNRLPTDVWDGRDAHRPEQPKPPTTHPDAKASHSSKLQDKFLRIWNVLNGPVLEKEIVYIEGRKFRLDFAHAQTAVGIEIQGAVFGKRCKVCGEMKRYGHATPAGLLRDHTKNNLGIISGWRVFQLSEKMVNPQHILPIIQYIERNQKFFKDKI